MVERLSPDAWTLERHASGARHVFRDVDGYAIARPDVSTYAEQRKRQSRLPVLIGTRGADAFWWYQGEAYRSPQGLAWWDVEAMADGAPVVEQKPRSGASPAGALPPRGGKLHLAVRHAREQGLRASARRVEQRLRPFVWLDETHIWSVLRLDNVDDSRQLRDGLVLTLGHDEHLDSLEELPSQVGRKEAERRLAEGAQLWVVMDGESLAFACWIFRDFAPVTAAPGGRFRIPPRHVVLEDSATSDAYRGRGVAPAAWLTLARQLRDAGYSRILTKVEVANAPSRRAVSKAGFVEGAAVHLRRVAATNHVTVRELESAEVTQMLRARLG